MMKHTDRWLVEWYGYFEGVLNFILSIFPPTFRKIFYRGTFASFGKNVFIGEKCYFKYPWKIRIGDAASIGMGCQIYPSYQFKDAFVIIENNVMTAPNLVIFGAGHPVKDPQSSHVAESVIIRRNAYIGGNVTIRYGVEIGESAVIAAGSIVTKDVAPFTVVGGNPAKFLANIERGESSTHFE
jgi:acetyltransferase-like isoleucine patch superfamily enzyme